ncbi:unnamed protein product [Bursaphelenchus xylophilus]|uniref:(pine wood nematode) hypothetical protein n=1 Tax=Bursaphelenchus xylophilus TaxID=6326 RepID=A0A1I7SWI2_BURXY|nr:unnamed protein product [Bursaphelenchus xylophilus]CAG9099448.1 unnamed protein product [Bursaphelenchus xylophilus]
MERRLLIMARENYNELKKEFQLVLQENKRLRQEAKREIDSEIEFVRQITREVLHEIELEKKIREEIFDEFKSKTVSDIREMYEKEVSLLLEDKKYHGHEVTTLKDTIATQDVQIEELRRQLKQANVSSSRNGGIEDRKGRRNEQKTYRTQFNPFRTSRHLHAEMKEGTLLSNGIIVVQPIEALFGTYDKKCPKKFPGYGKLEAQVELLSNKVSQHEDEIKENEKRKTEEIEKRKEIEVENKRLQVENSYLMQEVNRLEDTVTELAKSKLALENVVSQLKDDLVKKDREDSKHVKRLEYQLQEMTTKFAIESQRYQKLEESNQKNKNKVSRLKEENKKMMEEVREFRKINQFRLQKKEKRDLELQNLMIPRPTGD